MKKLILAALAALGVIATASPASATVIGAEATTTCTTVTVQVTNNYDRPLELVGYGAFAAQPSGTLKPHATATWTAALNGTTKWGFNLNDPITHEQVNSTGDRYSAPAEGCEATTTAATEPAAPPPLASTTTTAPPTLGDPTGSIVPAATTTTVADGPSFEPLPTDAPEVAGSTVAAVVELPRTGAGDENLTFAAWAIAFLVLGVSLCLVGVFSPAPSRRRRR